MVLLDISPHTSLHREFGRGIDPDAEIKVRGKSSVKGFNPLDYYEIDITDRDRSLMIPVRYSG